MNFNDVLSQVEIEDKPFFRSGDVRRIFGISRATLAKWLECGDINAVIIHGQRHYTRASLKTLCEKGSSNVQQ